MASTKTFPDSVEEKNGEMEEEFLPPQTHAEMQVQTQNPYVAVRFEEMLIESVNPTTLNVDWCPLLNCDNIQGYRIRYAVKDTASHNEVFVTPGISSYALTGLKPACEYEISVYAMDDKGQVIQICGEGAQRTDEFEDDRLNQNESPNITAVVGIMLLLVAVVVPLAFLFLKKCEPCSASNITQFSNLNQDIKGKGIEKVDNEIYELLKFNVTDGR